MYRFFLLIMLSCMCACNCTTQKPVDDNEKSGQDDVVAYVTKCNMSQLFKKSSFAFDESGIEYSDLVTYDKTKTGQEIDGFGLALTTASCYNLLKMSQEDRTAFLKETFSKTEGVGLSLIRVSIGASDFPCQGFEYTWCDTEGIENFAVHQEDRDYLFPILKEIYAINPDVKIIGSPWSCPRWMKCQMPGGNSWDVSKFNVPVTDETTYNSWTGGRLKPSCYDDYALYFVKWIQAMENEGFDIHAITMQNEPLNPGNSMSMVMPWQDQKEFIKVLGPEMEKAGLADVKILLFDHNYNYDDKDGQGSYPLNIYADAEAYKWADGSAWHNYGGRVTELDNIYAANPEKDIYFTEASIGEWNYTFEGCLVNDFSSIFLGTLLRGGKGVTLWNLMLDDKKGPYSPQDGSCKTCFGGVTINSSDYKTITKNTHWYNVAHASAVIKPGAKMIQVSGVKSGEDFEYQMFLNPDGTIGVIICNKKDAEQLLVFTGNGVTVKYIVPSRCIASLIWQE